MITSYVHTSLEVIFNCVLLGFLIVQAGEAEDEMPIAPPVAPIESLSLGSRDTRPLNRSERFRGPGYGEISDKN